MIASRACSMFGGSRADVASKISLCLAQMAVGRARGSVAGSDLFVDLSDVGFQYTIDG